MFKMRPLSLYKFIFLGLLYHYELKLVSGSLSNPDRNAELKLKRWTEEVCPGKGDKFDEVLNSFKKCSKKVESEHDLSLCDTVEKNLKECTKDLVKFYEECLPEKSKDLPQFVISSMEDIYDTLCNKMDGEHIIEIVNPCFKEKNTHTDECVREYRRKYGFIMRELAKNSHTKSILCREASDLRPCIIRHVNASCEATVTRETFVDLFDAIFEPCGSIFIKQ